MNSLLYYDPYHHHDPTIIGVHTLLKAQAYQQSNSFHTPPSQFSQYINQPLLPSNLTNITTHPTSATEQYWASHTPVFHQHPTYTPNFTYQQPINKDPRDSQYSIHHPTLPSFNNTPTPFNITQSHTYVTPKQICEQPANTFSYTVEQLKVVPEKDHQEEATNILPIWKPVLVTTAITTQSIYSVSKTDETLATCEEVTHAYKEEPHGIVIDGSNFSNIFNSISEIMDEQKGFIVDTFNFDLVPDSVQERKQHVTEECKDSSQSRLELNGSNVVFSAVNINIVSAVMDQHVITSDFLVHNIVLSSELFDIHPLILDPGGYERRVQFLATIFDNDVCVFNPGGDERIFGSPTLISINNHGTRSPLQVPWDRGKLGVSKSSVFVQSFELFLFTSVRSITPQVTVFDSGGDKFIPVADSDDSRRIFSLLWLPWGKKSCSKEVCSAELFEKKSTLMGESD